MPQRLMSSCTQMAQSVLWTMGVGYVICPIFSLIMQILCQFWYPLLFLSYIYHKWRANTDVNHNLFSLIYKSFLQIPTDLHPATKKSSLETVLTVLLHNVIFHNSNMEVLQFILELHDHTIIVMRFTCHACYFCRFYMQVANLVARVVATVCLVDYMVQVYQQ